MTTLRWFSVLFLGFALVTFSPDIAAADGEPEDIEEEVPDGCFSAWLCYMPPSDDDSAPAFQEKKWMTYFVGVLLGHAYMQWPLDDDDKVVFNDGDLLDLLKAQWILPIIAAAAVIPLYCLWFTIILVPLAYIGVFAMAIFQLVNHVWIRPVTDMHILNRAMKRQDSGKKKTLKKKRLLDEDDEEDDAMDGGDTLQPDAAPN